MASVSKLKDKNKIFSCIQEELSFDQIGKEVIEDH